MARRHYYYTVKNNFLGVLQDFFTYKLFLYRKINLTAIHKLPDGAQVRVDRSKNIVLTTEDYPVTKETTYYLFPKISKFIYKKHTYYWIYAILWIMFLLAALGVVIGYIDARKMQPVTEVSYIPTQHSVFVCGSYRRYGSCQNFSEALWRSGYNDKEYSTPPRKPRSYDKPEDREIKEPVELWFRLFQDKVRVYVNPFHLVDGLSLSIAVINKTTRKIHLANLGNNYNIVITKDDAGEHILQTLPRHDLNNEKQRDRIGRKGSNLLFLHETRPIYPFRKDKVVPPKALFGGKLFRTRGMGYFRTFGTLQQNVEKREGLQRQNAGSSDPSSALSLASATSPPAKAQEKDYLLPELFDFDGVEALYMQSGLDLSLYNDGEIQKGAALMDMLSSSLRDLKSGKEKVLAKKLNLKSASNISFAMLKIM